MDDEQKLSRFANEQGWSPQLLVTLSKLILRKERLKRFHRALIHHPKATSNHRRRAALVSRRLTNSVPFGRRAASH
jgi:hypothetical protein